MHIVLTCPQCGGVEALKSRTGGEVGLGSDYLVYAPYWRVRGLLFQWVFGRHYQQALYGTTSIDHFKKLRAVSYHRTFPAFDAERWGVFSLGLRAQVLKMRPHYIS